MIHLPSSTHKSNSYVSYFNQGSKRTGAPSCIVNIHSFDQGRSCSQWHQIATVLYMTYIYMHTYHTYTYYHFNLRYWNSHYLYIYIYINLTYPIGSMVLLYMVTWIPSIYPLYVSIYSSTMDPMGTAFHHQAAVKVQALERGRKARKQVRSDMERLRWPHRLVEFGHLQGGAPKIAFSW